MDELIKEFEEWYEKENGQKLTDAVRIRGVSHVLTEFTGWLAQQGVVLKPKE